MPAINIYISPNETNHKDRMQALRNAIMRHPDNWVYHEREMGIDLVFESEDNKFLAVEIKMPADYAESCRNGHMASQRRDCQYPLVGWVLGSMGDVMRALHVVGENGPKTVDQMRQDRFAVLRWTAKLRASGVDVRFGLSPKDFVKNYADEEMALKANIEQILREAKAYLESDYHLPMPKCESAQEAMLQCLPGVGPQRARDMLSAGISPTLVADEIRLQEVTGIGKVTARKIMGALR